MDRETTISLKEFRAQLLNTARDIESLENSLSHSTAAMYMQGFSSQNRFAGSFSQHGFAGSSSQNGFAGSSS